MIIQMNPTPRTPKRTPRRNSPVSRQKPGEWAWHYRTLLALRDHLRGGTGDRLRESIDAMESPSLHPEDLADERYDRELALALPQDRTEAWREIEDAIQRIRTGVYGRCEATGRSIPKSKLRETPWRRFATVPSQPQRAGSRRQ
jgi:RNA polymerase-binding transcription factor DksA